MKKNGGRRKGREEGAERVFFLLFLKTEEEEERSRGTPSQESTKDSPIPIALIGHSFKRPTSPSTSLNLEYIPYEAKGPFPPQPPCWVGMERGRKEGKKKKEERGGGERGKKAMPSALYPWLVCLSVGSGGRGGNRNAWKRRANITSAPPPFRHVFFSDDVTSRTGREKTDSFSFLFRKLCVRAA